MSNRWTGVCACLAIGVICGGSTEHLFAQQAKTGQVSGHVVDVVGATIKGANVYVRSNFPPEDDVKLLARTDIDGDFKLVLPEGGYDILVTSPGFAAAVETVPVSAGKTKKTKWRLKVLDCNFPGRNCDTFQY